MFVCSICKQQLTDEHRAGDYPDHEPVCFNCLATAEKKMNGVEAVYRYRKIDEANQVALRGYHIHQLVEALEQARKRQPKTSGLKHISRPIISVLIDAGVRGLVFEGDDGRLINALFTEQNR